MDVPIDSSEKEFTYYSEEEFSEEEIHTTDKQYEIWREIKLFKLDWIFETKRRAKERKKRREQRAEKMQKKQTPPSFVGKTNFLLEVEASDAAKSEYSWKQGIGCKTTGELVSLTDMENKRPKMEKKTRRTKQQMEKIEKSKTETKKLEKLTKQQIKEINKQNRQAFKQMWTDPASSG